MRAIEVWIREISLLSGGILDLLDAFTILRVCRIDPDRSKNCDEVRKEVIRYIADKFIW